ncbi:hypothetical protein BHE74_00019765 [Ensete ventricosum]|uniref:Uncharacterized protein n=1 Tax=Ensete ventricosum TaxID=4639 RepID=A0A444EVQ2_ENSVE|nr:hypothetical protein GW17_00021823 [Ensete ventricosum]RWW72428.1 hypothetical protein BHE74_00019765 [Ensete ventricosum]RZR72840.1 hypothetical protein BHM03_00017653 [Ensete ventricosum]
MRDQPDQQQKRGKEGRKEGREISAKVGAFDREALERKREHQRELQARNKHLGSTSKKRTLTMENGSGAREQQGIEGRARLGSMEMKEEKRVEVAP